VFDEAMAKITGARRRTVSSILTLDLLWIVIKLGHLVFGYPSARPPNRDRDNFFEAVQLDQNKL
jgi:hypothetical protein